MRDFEEAQAAFSRPGTNGWWERVIPQLSDQERADLMAAAASSSISHRAIAMVLTNWGYPVSYQQVGHWRRNYVR